MNVRTASILLLSSAILLLRGCSIPQPPAKQANPNAWFEEPTRIEWVECDGPEADRLLVTELGFRGHFRNRIRIFALQRKVFKKNEHAGRSAEFISADGVTPSGEGVGYSFGVDLVGANDGGASISVRLHWDSPGDKHGGVYREITVPFGGTFDEKLSEDVTFKAYFRKPGQAATSPTTQP